jgi:hypothetical protein
MDTFHQRSDQHEDHRGCKDKERAIIHHPIQASTLCLRPGLQGAYVLRRKGETINSRPVGFDHLAARGQSESCLVPQGTEMVCPTLNPSRRSVSSGPVHEAPRGAFLVSDAGSPAGDGHA